MAKKPPFKPFEAKPFVPKPFEPKPILGMPAKEPAFVPKPADPVTRPDFSTPFGSWHEPEESKKPEPKKPAAKAEKRDPQSDTELIAHHRSIGAPLVTAKDIAVHRYDAETFKFPAIYLLAPDYFCVEEVGHDMPVDPINPDRFKWQLIATHYGRNIHRARG